MKITISQAPDYSEKEVTIGALLANKRSSGKIAFLKIHDETGLMQAEVAKNDIEEEVIQTAKNLTQETSIYITRKNVEDKRSAFGYEIQVTNLKVIHEAEDYPITPKEHGT